MPSCVAKLRGQCPRQWHWSSFPRDPVFTYLKSARHCPPFSGLIVNARNRITGGCCDVTRSGRRVEDPNRRAYWKGLVITRACHQQGFAIAKFPQRGSGKYTAPQHWGPREWQNAIQGGRGRAISEDGSKFSGHRRIHPMLTLKPYGYHPTAT